MCALAVSLGEINTALKKNSCLELLVAICPRDDNQHFAVAPARRGIISKRRV